MAANNQEKTVLSQDDIEQMSELMLRRYGLRAREVADLLMYEHAKTDDNERADAWGEVAHFLASSNGTAPTVH